MLLNAPIEISISPILILILLLILITIIPIIITTAIITWVVKKVWHSESNREEQRRTRQQKKLIKEQKKLIKLQHKQWIKEEKIRNKSRKQGTYSPTGWKLNEETNLWEPPKNLKK